MINNDTILLAIILSAVATYICRLFGVVFSSSLDQNNWIFDWIKCISIGIIVAVISKIILSPEGILEGTSIFSRIISTFSLIMIYYLLGKNILLSVSFSTIIFTFLNFYY